MGAYTRTYSFSDGTTAYGSQVAAELDSLGNSVNNIVNAQIASNASIADTKLAQISTANKVLLAAVDNLENIAVPFGAHRNLKIVRDSVTKVTATADELILQNSTGECINMKAFNKSAEITASGAGGLDTGTEGNVWYYIWAIRKSSDGTTNLLLSAESAAASVTLPSGYDQYALIGAVHNTAGDFVDFIQYGKKYWYKSWVKLVDAATAIAGVTVDISTAVPSALSNIVKGTIWGQSGGAAAISNIALDITSAHAYANEIYAHAATSNFGMRSFELDVLTADSLFICGEADGYNVKLYIAGFEINAA